MKSIKPFLEYVNYIKEQTTVASEDQDVLNKIKEFVINKPEDKSLGDPSFVGMVSSNLSPLTPEQVSQKIGEVQKIKSFSNNYPEGADFMLGLETFKGANVNEASIKKLFTSDKSQFVRFVIENSGYLEYNGGVEPVVALVANRAQEDPLKGTFKEFEKGQVKYVFTFGPRFTSVFKVPSGQTPQLVVKADNERLFSIKKSDSGNYGILHDMAKEAQSYLTIFPKKTQQTQEEETKPRQNIAAPSLKRR